MGVIDNLCCLLLSLDFPKTELVTHEPKPISISDIGSINYPVWPRLQFNEDLLLGRIFQGLKGLSAKI